PLPSPPYRHSSQLPPTHLVFRGSRYSSSSVLLTLYRGRWRWFLGHFLRNFFLVSSLPCQFHCTSYCAFYQPCYSLRHILCTTRGQSVHFRGVDSALNRQRIP